MGNWYSDPDKWDDDWYLNLSPKMKLAWNYLCDLVKGCGERKISFRKMSADIGDTITREEFDVTFEGRVYWIDQDTVWVPGTLNRIYKTLSPRIPAHINAAKKVLRLSANLKLSHRGEQVRNRFKEFLESIPGQGLASACSGPALKSTSTLKDKRINKGGVGERKFSAEAELVAAIPEKTHKRWLDLYQDQTYIAREIKKAWGYYHEDKIKPEPVSLRGWCKALSTWLERGLKYHENKTSTASSLNWDAEAELFLKVVKDYPPGDPKVAERLGPERFSVYLKIGRQRIGSTQDNSFGRRDLANLIKSHFEGAA